MRRSARLRIIIPAHNEEARISAALQDFCTEFRDDATVLVVSNGCTDGTAAFVAAACSRYPNLRLIDIPIRIGKGGAVRAGLATGDEPFIGFVDADHSTSAAEYRRLLGLLTLGDADGVIASRWMKGSQVEPRQPLARRVASRCFNAIARLFTGIRFQDTQCGAKIFKRSAIEAVFNDLEISDFAFDIDLLARLQAAGFALREVPTIWCDKALGSKVRLLNAALRMFGALLRLRLSESRFASLPYFEFFARRSVIPVAPEVRVLFLGDRDSSAEALSVVQHCADRLMSEGHHVDWLGSSAPLWRRVFDRCRLLGWYIFKSNRRYTAVVEIGGQVPFFIPWFSAKPSFLVVPRSLPPVSRSLYEKLYTRCRRVGTSHADENNLHSSLEESVGDPLNALVRMLKMNAAYDISFHRTESGWSVRSFDGAAQSVEYELH
jgi:dolichol-phosphate mannosyltransferase